MALPSQAMVKNRLLASLTPPDYAILQPHLDPIDCASGMVLQEFGKSIDHSLFLIGGIGSVIAQSVRGQSAEALLVGRDSICPSCPVMGDTVSSYRVIIQVPGQALRIAVPRLREALDASASMRAMFLRAIQANTIQTAYTALTNTGFAIEERLARWLLMCHDRIDGDEMLLTHEFLSLMLAVRRPSVTVAMHMLEGERYVQARRARITILDRRGLEEFASDAYGIPEAAYERLVGPLRKRPAEPVLRVASSS